MDERGGKKSGQAGSSSKQDGGVDKSFDVQDALDIVNSSEERIFVEGYEEGFKSGTLEGNIQGWSAGLTQGERIGIELGIAHGICSKVIETFKSIQTEDQKSYDSKIRDSCVEIVKLIDEFPFSNVEGEDLALLVSRIRGKMSKVKSSMKLTGSVDSSGQKFSF